MRFIFNFIFFGVLFYIIYLFFPDAFHTLVSAANNVYEFFKELILGVTNKVRKEDAATTTRTIAYLLNLTHLV